MGQRRLLSIDGGGIRGIIAISILCEIEKQLQTKGYGRLSDYFDFISGTSTGSIIATGLATGMTATEILEIYKTEGKKIFSPAQWTWTNLAESSTFSQVPCLKTFLQLFGWLIPKQKKELLLRNILAKYSGKELLKVLKSKFPNEMTLGSQTLRTNLMIVTKNVTRSEPWFFVNNIASDKLALDDPKANRFLKQNANIPLSDIVRASCAAPTFFPPHKFLAGQQEYEFVDGGVSSFNNSSFQLFLEATDENYGSNWDTGVDNLLLVSIGTGYSSAEIKFGEAQFYDNLSWAKYIAGNLMEDANQQQNLLLKLISYQRKKGSQNNDLESKYLTYCRFTTSFTEPRFKQLEKHGLKTGLNPSDYIQMDYPQAIKADVFEENLRSIGEAIAKEQFDLGLFEGFF